MKPNYVKTTHGQGKAMKEIGFIGELEKRAELQKKLVETEMMPEWAKGIGDWFVVHPWRVIVPISILGYVLLRIMGGSSLAEFVLGLFGGFK